MVPFVIALLFAFLLIPIADFLLKLRIPSILANAIVLVEFGIILIGLVFLVYGALSSVGSRKIFINKIYDFSTQKKKALKIRWR
jgi:predicted PurR-regulated permease PerM